LSNQRQIVFFFFMSACSLCWIGASVSQTPRGLGERMQIPDS